MNVFKNSLQRLAESGLLVPILFAVVLLAIYGALSPGSLSPNQLKYTLINASLTLALAAAGLAIVVIVGGLDMSPAGVIAMTNAILTINYGGGPAQQIMWILASVAIGVLAGLVNGLIVTAFKLEPVVVTLGTGFVYSGIALLLLPKPRGLEPVAGDFSAVAFLTSDIGGVPVGLLIMLLVIVGWALLRRSRFGAQLMSVGSDEESAQYSGFKVRRIKLVSFAIAGGLYGAAGAALTSQTSGGDSQIGTAYLLAAFAAVVVGGTSLRGGQGSLWRTALGVVFLGLITNAFNLLAIDPIYQSIVQGAIVLVAVGADALTRRRAG